MLSRTDLAEYLPLLAKGALVTVEVFVCALVVATLLGMVWALMRVSGVRALSRFSKALINIIRGIPILVLIFGRYSLLALSGLATLFYLLAAWKGVKQWRCWAKPPWVTLFWASICAWQVWQSG